MRRILPVVLFILLWSGISHAQAPSFGYLCNFTVGIVCGPNSFVGASNPLVVAGTFSASISGFTPGGTYANLTATASSASVALPAGVSVQLQNTGTTAVSCTLGVGSATATANQLVVQPGSTKSVVVGSNTFAACIDQTGSTSNVVVLAGGSGLGSDSGGGGGGSGGGGASTIADGADIAEGATTATAYAGSGATTTVGGIKGLYTQLAAILAAAQGPVPAGSATIGGVLTSPGSRTLVALSVSTVTTGGTAVTAMATGARTAGGFLQNPRGATIDLCINEIGTASGTTSAGSTTCIPPGVTYIVAPAAGAVSVITSDSAHPFSGISYQ